jgi:hypothetical protein
LPTGTYQQTGAPAVRFTAYLDANSGSMFMAALASGVAGIVVVFRLFWHRITGVFSPRRRAEAKAMAAQTASEESAPSPVEPTTATETVDTAAASAEASSET